MSDTDLHNTAPAMENSAETTSDHEECAEQIPNVDVNHEAVEHGDVELSANVTANDNAGSLQLAELNAVKNAAEDSTPKDTASTKQPLSIKVGQTKGNAAPPTPLVKKILNSGTFGSGSVGKVPAAKTDTKSIHPPPLSKSTSSSAATKTSMASAMRTPATTAPANRRLSVVPAKPAAPPLTKPTLSASANAKPSKPSISTGQKPVIASGTRPTPSPGATRPSVVSPTGSVASASSRPKASVSEGAKRSAAAPASRQSLAASTKQPIAPITKVTSSRASLAGVSAASSKPARPTTSISSIREVKEDSKMVDDLQSQIKHLTETLAVKSDRVTELETQLSELSTSLEAAQAERTSQTTLLEQLSKEKTILQNSLPEPESTLSSIQNVQRFSETTLQQQLEEAKATSVGREKIIEGLRTQIQTLEEQLKSTQETLDHLKSTTSADIENAVIQRENLVSVSSQLVAAVAESDAFKDTCATRIQELEAQIKALEVKSASCDELTSQNAQLVAAVADADAFKEAHVNKVQELEADIKALEVKSASFDELSNQIVGLKVEKDENSVKLSELEVEILEMREIQEAGDEEREKLLIQIKALEAETVEARASTDNAINGAKAREIEFAREEAQLKTTLEAALQTEIEKHDVLTASIQALNDNLEAVHIAHEQTKADASQSTSELKRQLEEAGAEAERKQITYSEEIARITSELTNQENYYDSKVAVVKEEHATLLQEAFERAKAEASTTHTQELQALRAASTSSIEQLQAANQSVLEEIKAEHSNLLGSEVQRLEKTITTLKIDLKATQDDLVKAKGSLEACRAEVLSLTGQRDQALADASNASDAAAHVEEIARLTRELSVAKDDLATANEMLNVTKISLTELSHKHTRDLGDVAQGRAEAVSKLLADHSEEVTTLVSQNSELAIKVSDLEGDLISLRTTLEAERAIPKANGNGAVSPLSPGVTKEELQRLHEAHNLKLHDLAAEHEKVVKALKDELDASHAKTEELNAEVQRKVMEIQYLEQDQEENQDQLTRLTEERDALLNSTSTA